MRISKQEILKELIQMIRECQKCSELVESRTNVVPGDGNLNAKIMFVGEAPGADEDRQGIPFVGAAGQNLNKLLASIGLDRKEVYIANVLKCRPPKNRPPLDPEINNCRHFLHAQITLVKPKLICTLGNPSLQTLIDKKLTIGRVHGQLLKKDGINFVPIYHPAAPLHKPQLMDELVKDFEALGRYLKEMKQ